ncbi:MAG: PEP-CTERM sorting domain-containing protein, partial [Phycisphaerales bacterium]|nr:PEP-CTERM sorting domain-containing protein [Phycisphaerales bacterium]
TFTAAAAAGNLQSSGSLSRNVSPLTQATFRPGFVTLDAGANVNLVVTVENPTATTATGSGTLAISDSSLTTDRINASFSGSWSVFPGGGVFFNASSVTYTIANPSGDLRFNGSNGTSADLTSYVNRTLTGALNQLFLDISAPTSIAQAFGSSFQNVATTATGQIIPAPGSIALLGLGGLVAARRRRD